MEQLGEGTVVYTTIKYDEKRQRNYLYEITDTAMLLVKSEDGTFLVTKMIARPKRILQYWEDAPETIIKLAVEHTRAGYTF